MFGEWARWEANVRRSAAEVVAVHEGPRMPGSELETGRPGGGEGAGGAVKIEAGSRADGCSDRCVALELEPQPDPLAAGPRRRRAGRPAHGRGRAALARVGAAGALAGVAVGGAERGDVGGRVVAVRPHVRVLHRVRRVPQRRPEGLRRDAQRGGRARDVVDGGEAVEHEAARFDDGAGRVGGQLVLARRDLDAAFRSCIAPGYGSRHSLLLNKLLKCAVQTQPDVT